MQVLYFSWLRERIGVASEEIETNAATPAALISELIVRSDAHALAFADNSALRVAIDQELAEMDTALDGAKEVAFFPPVTGG